MVRVDKMEMIRLEATKELSRRNLLDFLIFDGNGRYKNSRHIQFLSDKAQQFLEDVKAGKSPRLYICMPPRHSKSETMTKKFPAWIIGNNPVNDIIKNPSPIFTVLPISISCYFPKISSQIH